jgi:hypothetical protein
MDSEPFVEIFAFWELNRKSEVPGSLWRKPIYRMLYGNAYLGTHQRRFGIFPELILLGALGDISAWLEGACLASVKG